MIKDRPEVSVQPWPPHIDDQAWPFANIDEQTWITGSHEELQQRILVLTNFAQKYYQVAAEDQQLRQEIADLEEENELLHRQTVSPQNSDTDQSPHRDQITRDEIHAHILQEHAVQLWFNLDNGQTIPLHRGDTTHTIIGGNMQIQAAVPRDGETLHLSEEEICYFQDYSYQHLLEHYSQERCIVEKHDAFNSDLQRPLDRSTVPPSNSETGPLSPYTPEHLDAKLTSLKRKYQSTPNILITEIEEIARSAWKSLDSNYRHDQDRREREDLRQHIQQVTELIAAEKDVIVGLVEENMSRYPNLDAEMTIPVGQFNQRHVGVKDDTTVTKKFRALHKIGVLLDYIPGTIDKSNPERPFTTPARIRLNPDLVRTPSNIKKPEELKPGGDRQSICKVPDCPASDPFNEAEHRTDKYSLEYCHLTDTAVFDTLPGQLSDANVHKAISAVERGRIIITERLHQFAENAKQQAIEAQKHDAFEAIEATTSHIYVDDIATFETKLPYKQWCHMATNGPLEDLHDFAAQIGLKREWFQDKKGHPHYDLTPSKRKQAITRGAIAVSSQELIQACHPHLAAAMNGQKQNALSNQPKKENTGGDSDHCTTCHIPIDQAEDFYFSEDGTGYCCQHGPQARPQIGQRVETPAGPAIITNITDCPILKRLRCSVTTDQQQTNGSHFQAFDLSEVHPVAQSQ